MLLVNATAGNTALASHRSRPLQLRTKCDLAVDRGSSQCPMQSLQKLLTPYKANQNVAPVDSVQPTGFAALRDLATILAKGLHEAMIMFEQRYGAVCRFPNSTKLNDVTGWVFLSHPDDVAHVCTSNVRNYTDRYLPDIYKWVTHEKGILGSQGEYNRAHRKLCQPTFRNLNMLEQFAQVVVARSQLAADTLSARAAGGSPFTTDISEITQRVTLDIVGLVAFSHDFQQTHALQQGYAETRQNQQLIQAVNTFNEILGQVFIAPLALLQFLERLGLQHLQRLRQAMDVMRDSMMDVIQERRQLLAEGQPIPQDLLGQLMQAVDSQGRPMTDAELWEDVHDVMGAGHETTATTTAAALYCIAAHPEVERRVRQEVQQVAGGRPLQFNDLEQMPYLTATIKEVLRLYPAIPIFPRKANEDDILPSGHRIFADEVVFMSGYSLGRSSNLWETPLEFRPERFLGEAAAKIHRFQYAPFGAGPRMCLGASFAQMSVALSVATLMQSLRFIPVSPSTSLIPINYDITMNFPGGLNMTIQRLQPSAVPAN